MNPTSKKVIAIVVSAFLVFIAWYGSYLPMRKAEIYISTLQGIQTNPVSTVSDLEQRISVPLNEPSPIGQEELVRNMANSVLGFIQQSNDASSTAELINYLTNYYEPILSRGKGMSFGQDLYLMGAINEMAYTHIGDKAYLDAAEKYYAEGVALGPDRPQVLYGLFDVYRMEGNVSGTETVASTILKNWPSDQSVQQGLMQFLIQYASSSASSTK
jgi:hypothetical protein